MPRACFVCLAAVLACEEPAAPAVEEAQAVPDDAVCDPVRDWDEGHAEIEADFLRALNDLRAGGGRCGDLVFAPASPVHLDPALRCAARLHSQDMAARPYLGEVDPDGLGTAARLVQVDYVAATFGENVGFGYKSAASALSLWADSPVNCWKLYAREFTAIGVGVDLGEFDPKDFEPREGLYWSVVFATP